MHRSTTCSGHTRRLALFGLLVPALALGACSNQPNTMTSPSATSGSTFARGGGPAPSAPNGSTSISFSGYDESTLSVTVNTTTTSSVGQPYIDEGKIHLSIWVDATGVPVPYTQGAAGSWIRVDQAGGGKAVVSGATSTLVDLDSLATTFAPDITANAKCGDTVTFRAQYVTGGGSTKVDTHTSSPTDFTIVCSTCTTTFGQGYWKNHPDAWPVTSLTLGARAYTQTELISILDSNSPNSNALIQLAIQLIAAKLNRANGAPNTNNVDAQIAAADTLIGSLVVPPVGSDFVAPGTAPFGTIKDALEAYNKSCSDED